jgi:hypothetical protein
MQALEEGDTDRCRGLLTTARRGVVASLALTPEAASSVDPALVRLQMLRAVGEAWTLRWPSRALSTLPTLLGPGGSIPSMLQFHHDVTAEIKTIIYCYRCRMSAYFCFLARGGPLHPPHPPWSK